MKISQFLRSPKDYLSPAYLQRKFFPKTVSVPWYGLNVDQKNNPQITYCAEGLVSSNYFGGRCDEDFQSVLTDLKDKINQELYFEWRIYFYLQNVMHQLAKCYRENKRFLYLECGVGEAHMLSVVHAYLEKKGGKLFQVFSEGPKVLMDTFAGVDPALLTGQYEYLKSKRTTTAYFDVTLDKLKNNLSHIHNIIYIQGSIPGTLKTLSDEYLSPSLLHIDMNNPLPEVAALDFFYSKMATGSVIIFDDYGFPGVEDQNLAINQWCDANELPRPLNIPTGQGLIIK